MVSEEQNSDIELASEVVPVPQVQPEVEAPEVMNVTKEEANKVPHGKHRQRKKALYAAILKQMEFYFGDSNLSKDRFIAGLIKENPDIDLEIFLRFNRIRSLTTDVSRIAKALGKSTMLQVSEDGTKVRRITPILEKLNVDECTVYVQGLPSDADHEWLQTLFSEYGLVAYVSIPKYKLNHKIKGFAFVEFDTPEGAEKCLKAFRRKGCELPSHTAPTDVLSITTFNDEEKQEQNGSQNSEKPKKNNAGTKVDEDEPKAKKRKESITDQSDSMKSKKNKKCDNGDKDSSVCPSDSNTEEEKRGKKRKNRLSLERVQDPETESQKSIKEGCKKQKKVKTGESEAVAEPEGSTKSESDKNGGKKRKKSKFSESEAKSESESSTKNGTDKEDCKKRRKIKVNEPEAETNPESSTENETDKKGDNEETVECSNDEGEPEKKKKKKRKRKHRAPFEVLQTVNMGLQVMSKRDWKRLRNKYLDLQRSKMKQLKQNVRRARWNQWGDRNRVESEHEETTGNKKENPASNLEFIPGVIVKVQLNEPCIDTKGFKADLKSNSSNIKYVDIKEGSHEAYIRCDSSEAATALAQKTSEDRNLTILTGGEESSYWDKIKSDRKDKIGNKVRVKQRGRDKLLKRAEKELGKHIKFDEV